MSARAPTTEAIINAFTEPITSIIGPRHAEIKRFLCEIKINARSVRCDTGGGQHGYVWMLEDEPAWLARDGITTAAVSPTDAGACSATGTVAEREAARWLWEEAKYTWQYYINIEVAFQKLIKENINSDYLDELANPDEGLVDVTDSSSEKSLNSRFVTSIWRIAKLAISRAVHVLSLLDSSNVRNREFRDSRNQFGEMRKSSRSSPRLKLVLLYYSIAPA
jgi:hypothetical protein